MRIFYAADTTPNAAFRSNLWRNNLYLPLVDLGHDVVEFGGDLRSTFRNLDPSDPAQAEFIRHNRPRLTRGLLRQIRRAHARRPIDLFFSYFYDACVLPEAIDEIRSLGIVTVNWFCNGAHQMHLVSEISPRYDWCLVPERFRLKDYEALGARPVYCQEAANPAIYRPYDLRREYDVTFVGQAYGERPALIAHLLACGIAVQVWGHGWEGHADAPGKRPAFTAARRFLHEPGRILEPESWRSLMRRAAALASPRARPQPATGPDRVVLPSRCVGSTLADEDMIRMYSRSKINLGLSSVGDSGVMGERILQVRLRDFEVPMSGGFYVVEYMPEIEEFFEVGREIVCYHDRDDLAGKIRHYLSHDPEREAIRLAGHRRALTDHTWHRRFRNAFERMGLPPTGGDTRTRDARAARPGPPAR